MSDESDHSSKQEIFKAVAAIATACFTGILIPIAVSINSKVSDHSARIIKLESWQGDGRRYTSSDALKDYGVITSVLESQGLKLDDHENRIRSIERNR